MKTKDKIIAQAIATYNSKGMRNVTSRDLAKELGISHGNLEYHFPNKGALLLAIYEQMRQEISVAYEVDETVDEPFGALQKLLDQLEGFQEKYLFFNLDFLEIGRNFQKVGALLDETFLLRKKQLTLLFEKFRQSGYVSDRVDDALYARLLHSTMFFIMFWKKQEYVLPFKSPEQQNLAKHVWDLLLPYMTQKGKDVYHQVNNPAHA